MDLFNYNCLYYIHLSMRIPVLRNLMWNPRNGSSTHMWEVQPMFGQLGQQLGQLSGELDSWNKIGTDNSTIGAGLGRLENNDFRLTTYNNKSSSAYNIAFIVVVFFLVDLPVPFPAHLPTSSLSSFDVGSCSPWIVSVNSPLLWVESDWQRHGCLWAMWIGQG